MSLAELATRRRVTVIMFTTAVILFGLVSLSRLKVNLLPDIAYPTLTVRTELTGAAPLEIENLLTKPIEEAVGVVKNVRQVRSVSRSGQSDVTLEFVWGTNMDLAAVDVREKLDTLQLPLEAKRPLLLRFDPASEPIVRLALMDARSVGDAPLETSENRLKWLRRFAEDQLKTDLEGVEGTAAVKVSGGLEDEIQILVDEDKVASLGYSIETIAGRIRAENVNLSGGRLEQGAQRFLVRTLNEFTSVEEIARTIIATPDGRVIHLDDVAEVVPGYKEREAVTRVDGRESVELAIYKEGDGNTVQIASRLHRRVESLREALPADVELRELYDQSRFINAAIGQVRSAALVGGLLAVLVLYLFLRDLRSTLIIGATIPVSVIGTFVAMYGFNLTLNIMSLGGIALAVGLLVDNSIVVLENVFRRREAGDDVVTAAREGTTEVGMAITAATLTSIAVFFPMVFVSGIAGQLFRDQALTVTFALAFSLLVAVTLIPMLASLGGEARFREAAQDVDAPPGRFTRGVAVLLRALAFLPYVVLRALGLVLRPLTWLFQRGYDLSAALYRPVLAAALRHRLLVVLAAVLAFAGAVSLVPRLGTELIPQLSQGEFNVDLRLPPGTPLAATDAAARDVQQAAAQLPGYARSFSVAGTGNRLDANPVDAGENTAQLSIKLAEGAAGRSSEDAAMAALRRHLERQPGVEYEFSRPALFSFSTPLEVVVRGYDLDKLQAVSDAVAEAMRGSTRFADVRTTMEAGQPEIQIVFDHERAARLGLAVRDIADEVVAKVRGEVATRYTLADRKIDVLVRSLDTEQASVAEVRQLIVNPESARPVTLENVADIHIAEGPAEIRRADQERVALVEASLARGNLGDAVAELDTLLAGIPMPDGVTAAVGGQNEEMEASFASMRFALLMAVFLVYLVMASQFESLIHPFVILLTVPLALVGAVLALWLTGTSINVVALIGAIMLVGIVVNNAIVLVDYINQARARGMAREAAIMEAGQARLRPILMTTLTTVLGLLPMALGVGEGAEIRAPMAITVIGGLLVATLLTLVVIPVVYSLLDRKRFVRPAALEPDPLTAAGAGSRA